MIFIKRFFDSLLSLLLVIIVIGGIVGGIFTATEAAAIAVIYSFLLAVVVYREVKIKDLPAILKNTITTNAVVMFLIGAMLGSTKLMPWPKCFPSSQPALRLRCHV